MAQAKLWEEAFLKEMQAFQDSMADKFQVAFSAEVRTLRVPSSMLAIANSFGSIPVKSTSWLYLFLNGSGQ